MLVLFYITASGNTAERKTVILKGDAATLVFDLAGGSITDFHLNGRPVNPLTWNIPPKGDANPYSSGHFVCFDRLGNPSEAERKNGIPFHGEASQVYWEVLNGPDSTDTSVTATVKCTLPIGGMTLTRHLKLSRNSTVLAVTDTVKNINPLGRFYNLVQHPSLAAPFLDTTIRVDTNAWKGFAAGNPMPNPEEPVIYWPHFVYEDNLINLNFPAASSRPGVVSFRFHDDCKNGWITASNEKAGIMIGYIWETTRYPWVRVWRQVVDNIPKSLGIEFGTTPLPLPFGQILKKGDIFEKPTIEYLDANGIKVFSFIVFLSQIPDGWQGVLSIQSGDNILEVNEADSDNPRSISISYDNR